MIGFSIGTDIALWRSMHFISVRLARVAVVHKEKVSV